MSDTPLRTWAITFVDGSTRIVQGHVMHTPTGFDEMWNDSRALRVHLLRFGYGTVFEALQETVAHIEMVEDAALRGNDG